jgi:AcrR family transcriptional regulator
MAAAEVFHSKGYHEATLDEIANITDYTKGSIYYYVKSKQDLLYECNKLAMEQLISSLTKVIEFPVSPEQKLREAIKMHIVIGIEKLSLIATAVQLNFALQEPYKSEIKLLRDQYEKLWLSILDEGISNGSFKGFDKKIHLYIILGAMNNMRFWYKKGGRLNETEISEIYCTYLIPPLLKA